MTSKSDFAVAANPTPKWSDKRTKELYSRCQAPDQKNFLGWFERQIPVFRQPVAPGR